MNLVSNDHNISRSNKLIGNKNDSSQSEVKSCISLSRGRGLAIAATSIVLFVLSVVSKSDLVSHNSRNSVVGSRRLSIWNNWFDQVSFAKKRLGDQLKPIASIDGNYDNGGFGAALAMSTKGYLLASSPRGGDNGEGIARLFTTSKEIESDLKGEHAGDEYGHSVALASGYVNFAVGAPSMTSSTGAVYLYNLRSYRYVDEKGVVMGNNPGDRFGFAVAISETGDRLIVGAPGSEDTKGYIRCYVQSSRRWNQAFDDFYGFDMNAGDEFGSTLAMSPDGVNAVIGIPKRDMVQVYNTQRGTRIQLVGQALKGEKGEGFGHSVDMTSFDDVNTFEFVVVGTEAGIVRLYYYLNGTYRQYATEIQEGKDFGCSVSLSSGGDYFISGTPSEDHANVYYNSQIGVRSIGKVYGDNSNDKAGYSVSMVGETTYFAVGSPGANNGSGNAKIFRL